MVDEEKRGFAKWWLWILLLIIISSVALFGLNAAGRLGNTVVEREVFEQSYQYTAAQRERIATFESQLAEIETRLSDSTLDDVTRRDLEAQRSAIRVQLQQARRAGQ